MYDGKFIDLSQLPIQKPHILTKTKTIFANMKLIILDFDGTIGDTKSLIIKTFQDTIAKLGMPTRTDEECAYTIGLPLKEAFKNLFAIDDTQAHLCTETYRTIFYHNNTQDAVKPFPGTIETLHRLHEQGYILTIASSRSKRSLQEYIEQLSLQNIISFVLGADDTPQAKPNPQPALITMHHFSCRANETLVVGDTHYDILMGKGAGCHTCGVTYGNGTRKELEEAGAEYIIDYFSDIIKVCL